MATIAKLTSFSPQRLRAWERRYDLLRPKRGPGGHRLYGGEDLRLLRTVRELLDSGRSIGEINDIGRDALLGRQPGAAVSPALAEQWTRSIVEAALNMDDRTIDRMLDDAFASLTPELAIERVVVPAQERIGTLWSHGECSIASEHMATAIFVFRVRSLVEVEGPRQSVGAQPVLCACLPGERHELGLLAISYSLAIRGARIMILGADVPFEDLVKASSVVSPPGSAALCVQQCLIRGDQGGLAGLPRSPGPGHRGCSRRRRSAWIRS